MKYDYGLAVWGEKHFMIEDGRVAVNYGKRPSLLTLTHAIRKTGRKGPLLLRFPHLIRYKIEQLFSEFDRARDELNYAGKFHAVFPLKVNQFPNFVKTLMAVSEDFGYGLEAGSKAELIIAMAQTPLGSPITINGFKDKEMIALAFIGAKSGHNITLTIEGLTELETIIDVYSEFNENTDNPVCPKIGIRIRLHSGGVGAWAKSGGYSSKFGLTSTELLEACDMLESHHLIQYFWMIHFHIGSQMGEIAPLKKALREAGNIYADLKRHGAKNLRAINIGGGLAVEYSQHAAHTDRHYSLKEFANDVVFSMQEIARSKHVPEPDIFTESGRFIAANHAVLIAPVLELFSQEYHERSLRLKENNPPLIEELHDLYLSMNRAHAREYLHDALDHMESLLTLFDLGYIDLEDRSNTEILVHLIIKKAIRLLENEEPHELLRLQNRIQERYLVNFSSFQSLPDFWGLGQHFPIMPLSHLDRNPSRPASIWDITCDSDGEIPFDPGRPLYLHDIDVEKEEYFLAFFLTGAYQEILGMEHNLFTHPTEAIVVFNAEGDWRIEKVIEAHSLRDILDDLHYDLSDTEQILQTRLLNATNITDKEKEKLLRKLHLYLNENSYLKTIQSTNFPVAIQPDNKGPSCD